MKAVNFENEKHRQLQRERQHQFNLWLEENRTKLEAIAEGKRLSAYFDSDEDVARFVHQVNSYKELEEVAKGWHLLEEMDKAPKESAVPSRREISQYALYGGKNSMLEEHRASQLMLGALNQDS